MRVFALLPLLALTGCSFTGADTEFSAVKVFPKPCQIQGRMGRDATLNPHQLAFKNRGVCIRARFGKDDISAR